MHPGLKIFSFIFLLIVIFLPNGFLGLIILTIWIFFLYAISLIRFKSFIKTFSWIFIWMLILFIIDWFTYRNETQTTTLASNAILWGKLSGNYYLLYGQITYNLFYFAPNTWYQLSIYTVVVITYIFFKLLILFMLVQILVKTTSSVDMTNGFDMILKPLTYLKINTSSISLIFALVLRFIPNLISEAKTIYLAQKSKGVLNHKNKFFAKIKAYSTIIIPLFALGFEKTENISDAMIVKGFSFKNKKNYFFKYKLRYFDFIIASVSFAIVIFLIYLIASHTFFAAFGIANSIIINSVN